MPSIYDLTDQYRALEDAAYNDELDYDEFERLLASVEDGIENKVDGYCKIIAGLKADAGCLEAEAKRLTKRKQGLLHQVDRLKQALETALDAQGRGKIKTKLFTVFFTTSTRLEITDLAKVPPEYLKPITEESVRKTEIKRELVDTGEVLPWCRLVEGRSLSIR
ncbi:MAG: siphovirus Gp157 family protein [Candidatus Spyradocola sp.]|jgi:hypothetical protein